MASRRKVWSDETPHRTHAVRPKGCNGQSRWGGKVRGFTVRRWVMCEAGHCLCPAKITGSHRATGPDSLWTWLHAQAALWDVCSQSGGPVWHTARKNPKTPKILAKFVALMSSTLMLILILSVNNTQLNIFSLTAIRASFYSRNHALSDVSEIRGK